MNQYYIKPGSSPLQTREMYKTMLLRVLPILVMCIFTIGWPAYKQRDNADYSYTPLIIMGVTIPFLILIGILINRYRAKAAFQSYTLTLDGNRIRREMGHVPTLEISIEQIQYVRKAADGSLIIRSSQGMMNELYVPSQLVGIEEVESWLSQFITIEAYQSSALIRTLPAWSGLGVIVLMGIVFYSSNRIVVVICGPLLVGFFLWSAIQIQRSRNVDKITKFIGYFMFIVILCIAAMLYGKIRAMFM